jgi:glucokinase
MANLLLAGDIGGTKTLLGLFERAPGRPREGVARSYGTLDYDALPKMLEVFLREADAPREQIEAACFGVAGPVIDEAADLTNVPWRVDARHVADRFHLKRAALLNDLQAMAYSIPVLQESELHVLQQGEALSGGNIALIAAGTGLGEGLLHHLDGRFIASPSEGGHADFSARTEREVALLRHLTARYGRADVEHVISGRGLINIHRATHAGACAAGVNLDDPTAPAAISTAALEHQCADCVETLDLFVEAYGAEAGNLALRSVSTGGLFVGGGIAPKILSALVDGPFLRAFRAKTPLEALLDAVPVKIILNSEAGLLGAAVFAAV